MKALEGGKNVPLDPEERSDGNIVLEGGKARYLKQGEQYSGPRWVSHFATCPDRDKWRRDKGGSRSLPGPAAMADAIRDTTWTIKRKPDPRASAHVMFCAAAQVLHELGDSVQVIRDLAAACVERPGAGGRRG